MALAIILLTHWKELIICALILYLIQDRLKNIGKYFTASKNSFDKSESNSRSVKNDVTEYDNSESNELTPFLDDKEHIPYNGPTVILDGSAQRFYDIANNRRSVRKYSRKSIDYKIIEKCIHAAGTSPSGAHTQPWTFCVIEDPEIKSQIREIIENEEYINYQQRMSRQWTTDLQPLKTNHIKEYLTDAPYLILIFKKLYDFRPTGQRQVQYYNEISVPIAVGILLMAIQSAGLCSLVTTPLNCGKALRELLNRPINEKLEVLLPVGYAADDCLVPDLTRKKLDEILVKY